MEFESLKAFFRGSRLMFVTSRLGLFLALAGGILAPLTPVSSAATRELWSLGDQYVRLVPQDPPSTGNIDPNDHPITIAEDELGRALSRLEILGSVSLTWFSDSTAKTTPVFSVAEIEQLVPQIVRALTIARPDEDMVFAVVGMHPGTVTKERQAIAGRVFYHAGKLNVIFGDLHRPLAHSGGQDVRGLNPEVDRRLQPFEPGLRSRSRSDVRRIANSAGVSVSGSNDWPRPDWLVLDLAVAGAPVPAPANTAALPTPTATPEPSTPSTKAQPSDRSARARLRNLQELKDEGLINEQEYLNKRRSILEEL
jgi:hypothetical protein